MSYHIPVLLNESIEGLKVQPNGTYVDLTYGGGGHSGGILKRLDKGRLFAFDQDVDALRNKVIDMRLTLVHGNFRFMKNYLRYYGVDKVDGILADLGVSSYHFDESERGFSYRTKGPLDMRMNQEGKLTAELVLREYTAENLKKIFVEYGEISNSNKLVASIDSARRMNPITTIQEFISVIQSCIPMHQESKYLSKVFQALRIEVNQEIAALRHMLEQTVDILNQGGRLVIITYHSLEDRLVKNFTKTGNFEGVQEKDFYGRVSAPFIPVNRKVIVPGEKEISQNPRSRSAKLRISERQ
jgi:16S rRNA (cytosine1402-N4)-methyltransferase